VFDDSGIVFRRTSNSQQSRALVSAKDLHSNAQMKLHVVSFRHHMIRPEFGSTRSSRERVFAISSIHSSIECRSSSLTFGCTNLMGPFYSNICKQHPAKVNSCRTLKSQTFRIRKAVSRYVQHQNDRLDFSILSLVRSLTTVRAAPIMGSMRRL